MRLFLVPFTLSLLACSNLGSIHGNVVNRLNGKPVEGVTVGLSGTTAVATTDKDGRYTLTDVAPGPQQVVLQEPNLLVLNELKLTVGERQKMEAQELLVVPKPPGAGLFGPFDDAQAYVTVREAPRSITGQVTLPDLSGLPSATSPVRLVLVEVADPLGAESGPPTMVVTSLSPVPGWVTNGLVLRPPSWMIVASSIESTGKVESLGAGIYSVEFTLASGSYCVQTRQVVNGMKFDGHCHAVTVVEKQDLEWVDNAPVAEGE